MSKIPHSPGKPGRMAVKPLFEDGTYDLEVFHDVFLEAEDMTEYKPALKLVGSWREWQRMKRDWPQFCDYIEDWKAELTVKLRSEAIEKVKELMDGDDSKALQAAKFIAEEGWDQKRGRGRPTKAERVREAKKLAQETAETAQDAARIEEALRLVKGGKV